ncbi:lysophospholipase [Minwuia sp.]|uniref:alpha/beta hydrolase n=1 Tax=Minwuia sp. TaxID=2493630 RepID=UPI003A95DB10
MTSHSHLPAATRVLRGFLTIILLVGLAACTQRYQPAGPAIQEAALEGDHFVMSDGYRLRLRQADAVGEVRTVVIALHGINDYAHAWREPAARWAKEGIRTYAYDQRGFGANADPGIWPTAETLVDDLADVISVVQARHPGKPVFLVGESMGGAVVMALLGRSGAPRVDGAVLSAPAVWSRETMNPTYQRVLSAFNAVLPGLVLRGNGLRRQPTDNIEMLRAMGRDPLVIKGARVDVIAGLVNLMDAAYAAVPRIETPVLVLYGEHDEIVPRHAVVKTLARFEIEPDLAVYPKGWHMLFRDLNGPIVQNDVRHWIMKGGPDLPSGAHERADFLRDGAEGG